MKPRRRYSPERFPYAERNERKGQLHIGRLEFYVDSPLIDEYGDEFDFCGTFVVDKNTCTISMESSGKMKTVTLDRKSMNKLLKSVIHYYEVFCWEEDYGHDIYPDDETQDDDNDDSPVWKIHIEYLNGETQDIQSSDDLPYKVEELAEELLGYFEPDEFDDEEFDEDTDKNYEDEETATLSTRLCKRSHKIYESQPCPQSKSSIPRMTPQFG